MKKSLLSLALFALMVAGTAHADTTTNAPAPQDLTRFDVSCNFGSVGCSAEARLFLNSRTEAAAPGNANWFGPLLAVSCRGTLISASDATLIRQTGESGVRWEIFNSDSTVEIDLGDHPFDGSPNPKTVNANLEIGHGSSSGSCTLYATDVH